MHSANRASYACRLVHRWNSSTAPRDRRPLRVAAPSSTRCDRSAPTPRCRLPPPSAVDIDEGRAAAVALHSRGSAHRFAGRFQVAPTAVRSYLGDGGLEQPTDERSSDQEEDKESDEAVVKAASALH